MTEKISGFSAAEPVAPVKGSNSNSAVTEKQNDVAAPKAPAAKSGDQVTLTSSARSLQNEEQYLAFLSLKFLLPKLVNAKQLMIRAGMVRTAITLRCSA